MSLMLLLQIAEVTTSAPEALCQANIFVLMNMVLPHNYVYNLTTNDVWMNLKAFQHSNGI